MIVLVILAVLLSGGAGFVFFRWKADHDREEVEEAARRERDRLRLKSLPEKIALVMQNRKPNDPTGEPSVLGEAYLLVGEDHLDAGDVPAAYRTFYDAYDADSKVVLSAHWRTLIRKMMEIDLGPAKMMAYMSVYQNPVDPSWKELETFILVRIYFEQERYGEAIHLLEPLRDSPERQALLTKARKKAEQD